MENKSINFRKNTQIKDNSNEILNDIFIEFNKTNDNTLIQENILENFLNILKTSKSEDVIYILSPKLNLMKSKREINSALERGVVLYAIVEDGKLLEEYFNKILIRESSNLSNSSIIIKESHGEFFGLLGQGNISDESTNFILKTDQDQSKDLKKYFVNTFWNKSDFEFRKNIKTEAKSLYENYNYDEIIESNNKINDIFINFIENNNNIYSKYLNNIDYSNLKKSSLQLEKKDLKEFEHIKNIGEYNDIFINYDNFLKPLLFTDNEGYYISDFENSKNTFIISLNREQLKEAKKYEEMLKSTSNFKYFPQITIGDINNNFFFLKDTNKGSKNITVKEQSLKILEPVKTDNIEDYLNYNLNEHINSLACFDKSDIALTYEYTLKVYPPYLPKKAYKAKLIKEWECFDNNLKAFLNKENTNLNESIKNINNNKNFLINLFKNQKINRLQSNIKQLNEIKNLDFSSLDMDTILEKLEEIKKITKNTNLDNIEVNSQIEENKIKELEKIISNLNKDLIKAEKNKSKWLSSERSRILKELESKKSIKASKPKQNNKKNKSKSTGLNSTNDDQIINSKINSEITQLKEINNLEKFIKFLNDLNLKYDKKSIDNLNTNYEKISKEINENKKNLQSKKDYLKNINKTFINSTFNTSLPKEKRNILGTLYEYNELRYLSITNETDLDEALKEGKRLNAKIVFES